ncbi:MAG: alpha/beta fold hydrolase [Planctomycetota bacterium]
MWWSIPGLGADARLHGRLRPAQPVRHLDFAGLTHLRSIAAVAAAIAARHLRPGDSLIGSSLGGMIAQHCAALVPLRHVVLLSSCRHAREIGSGARRLTRVSFTPVGHLLQAGAGCLQLLPHRRRMVVDMFCRADPVFMAAMGRDVARFNAPPVGPAQVHRLHGLHDVVIPPLPGAHYDRLLPCGHLLPLDQAAAVDAYLARLG